MKAILALSAVAGFAAVASAGIGVETYGAGAPPASVNGIAVTAPAFRADIFAETTTTPDGSGGNITFSSSHSVRQIGFGWATWSHGYTGNVFYTNGQTSITMTMAAGTKAMQFYAEPNPFGVFNITATGSDGTSSQSATQPTEGSAGATGWGFYGTGGSDVQSVRVTSDVDFAVGEFGTSKVPAPASLALLAAGGLIGSRRRRA